MVLDTSLLNTQQYNVRIKGKVEQFREKSSSNGKGSFLVALDYGRQIYFHLVSFDVENLFTDVSVNETIDIIMNSIYSTHLSLLLKSTLIYFEKYS